MGKDVLDGNWTTINKDAYLLKCLTYARTCRGSVIRELDFKIRANVAHSERVVASGLIHRYLDMELACPVQDRKGKLGI